MAEIDPVDERQRRIGRNEALFREVNERVERLNDVFESLGPMSFLCECGDETCFEKIELAREEYERIRSDAELFAIVPGHDEKTVEKVEERGERYWVVRKVAGEAAQVAHELDPRS